VEGEQEMSGIHATDIPVDKIASGMISSDIKMHTIEDALVDIASVITGREFINMMKHDLASSQSSSFMVKAELTNSRGVAIKLLRKPIVRIVSIRTYLDLDAE
jgi:hypothetical protein